MLFEGFFFSKNLIVQIWLKAPNFAQGWLEIYLLKCDRDPFDIFSNMAAFFNMAAKIKENAAIRRLFIV